MYLNLNVFPTLFFNIKTKKDKKDEPECLVWDLACRVRSLFVSFCVSCQWVCVWHNPVILQRKKCHYPLSKINTLWRCCCVSIFNIHEIYSSPRKREAHKTPNIMYMPFFYSHVVSVVVVVVILLRHGALDLWPYCLHKNWIFLAGLASLACILLSTFT